MTVVLLPLFLTLYLSVMWCLGAGLAESSEYMRSLNFLNDLRNCSIRTKNCGIRLPELSGYTKSSNSIVNSVIEEEYIKFWQMLQKQSYELDLSQMLLQSKGACIVRFHPSKYVPEQYRYSAEGIVMRPLFVGSMKNACLKCVSMKSGNVLNCILKVVKACDAYGALEKEMIICAINFLKMTVFIAQTSFHKFSQLELDRLRSSDCALSCIRDWDRNASIARILFLAFFLQARKIISHVSRNTEDSHIRCKLT